jgi:hypothetical protein
MPIILATWEAEIWRISIQGQSGKIFLETPCQLITNNKYKLVIPVIARSLK